MKTITFIVAMVALALIFAVAMWKAKKEEKQKEEKLAKSLEFLANELELSNGERSIKEHFDLLNDAILESNVDVAASESDELLALISERNNRCKKLK